MEPSTRKKLIYLLLAILVLLVIAGVTIGLVLYFRSEKTGSTGSVIRPLWGWKCEENRCEKYKLTAENNETAVGLNLCRLQCNDEAFGTLWPKPSGTLKVSREVTRLNLNGISFTDNKLVSPYFSEAKERFFDMQSRKIPKRNQMLSGGDAMTIEIVAKTNDMTFDYTTDEGYKLKISQKPNSIHVLIEATNFYGARHALESLSQLIVYDNIQNGLFVVTSVEFEDKPQFKHRGISLDTARNFISVDVLKRQINGMAMVKLNNFHWHISDSQSFPLILQTHPELAEWSAYSLDKVYTVEEMVEIVNYAKARGVQVIPEIDIPGHVGEGWFMANLTSCYSPKPSQPCKGAHPCGQLDPSKDEVYKVLQDIYGEILSNFQPHAIHMGADEVFMECWNVSTSLQSWMVARGWGLETPDFMKLWGHFQENAMKSYDTAKGDAKTPIILWSSTLTEEPYLTEYLDKDRFIIQVWTDKTTKDFQNVLKNGYKIIVSNSDALYLDCGFGSWVRDGNNWCSPYKGWQTLYDNRMESIAGDYIDQVIGAEAALWVEQVDQWSLDARIWPRASALAERLWSNPDIGFRDAESRMLIHRQYLVEIGELAAEQLQPEWCLQNEGYCPL